MSKLHNLTLIALILAVVGATATPSLVCAQEPDTVEAVEEAAEAPEVEEAEEADADQPEGDAAKPDETGEEEAADSEEVQEEELDGLIGGLAEAYQSQNWTLLFATALMILIVVVRKLGIIDKFVPVNAVPWVSLGIGVLWALGSALVAGQAWVAAIVEGLTVGLSATGLWEALGKTLLSGGSNSEDDSE